MSPKKQKSSEDASSISMAPINFSTKVPVKVNSMDPHTSSSLPTEPDVDIDPREVYFLIMHFFVSRAM